LLLLLIQKKGRKSFGSLVFLVQSGLGLRAAQLMILPLIPKGKAVKQKIGPLFLPAGAKDFIFLKKKLIKSNLFLVNFMELFFPTFVILKRPNTWLKGIVGTSVSQRQQFGQL